MSLIIGVHTPTGIIISGDSRTTGTITKQIPNPNDSKQSINVQTNITLSDATDKVFNVFDRFGVGTFGDALLENMPIAHYLEQFESQNQQNIPQTTEDLVKLILNFFNQFKPIPKLGLIVVGYDNDAPYVFGIDISNSHYQRHNFDTNKKTVTYGIVRGGDTNIVDRLLNNSNRLPIFQAMNLQDGIDFSRHLIRATIDQMRFEPAFPSVGGEIDTLLITNNGVSFLKRKELKSK